METPPIERGETLAKILAGSGSLLADEARLPFVEAGFAALPPTFFDFDFFVVMVRFSHCGFGVFFREEISKAREDSWRLDDF